MEKESTSEHFALGQLSGSDEAWPEIHLELKVRPESVSRLSKVLLHEKPSNSKPP